MALRRPGDKPLSEPLMVIHSASVSLSVLCYYQNSIPDSKVHGANMGPIYGRQDPGGPHVGPMKFAIWDLV